MLKRHYKLDIMLKLVPESIMLNTTTNLLKAFLVCSCALRNQAESTKYLLMNSF